VEIAHSLVAEVDTDGPTVVVDIDERTPPRPAIAAEVAALVTEAFRNAVGHAKASMIRISGRIDEHDGRIVVDDNGIGFDDDGQASGRYGLIGMEERAHLIGAQLDVESRPGDGTSVTIAWKDGP
jgi:signal transduction histidine kinase